MILALRFFWRSLHRGQFRWLWLAILLASLSVTFIEQLAQSVKASMLANSAQLLGADLIVKSTVPIQFNPNTNALFSSLRQGERISTMTMAMSNDRFQLVSLQAVSSTVPLLGSSYGFTDWQADSHQIVIDSVLATQWALSQGDAIVLGNRTFTVRAILVQADPLQNMASQFAPRVMIPLASLAELGLTGEGSRVSYERLFAGEGHLIEQLSNQLSKLAQPEWVIVSNQTASEDLGKTLNTAWLFLDIAALVSLLVAGLAILIASRFYLPQWQKQLALMRALGMTQAQLSRLFFTQFTLLAMVASAVGVLLGQGLFALTTDYLATLFSQFRWASPMSSSLMGLMSATLVFWAFSWPIFLKLVHTPPQQVLRAVTLPKTLWMSLFGSISALTLLLGLLLPLHLVAWTLLAIMITSLVLWIAATATLWSLAKIQQMSRGWFAIALANVKRDPLLFRLQLIAFGLVLYLLLLMTLVQQQLITHWQASLPAQSSNVFIVNVQPEQTAELSQQLEAIAPKAELIPMARARLSLLNGQTVTKNSPRAKRMLERESNLAVLTSLPSHNRVLESLTLSDNRDLLGVSVEKEIAELFNIQLGDQLTFDIVGQSNTFLVESIREVQWQSLQANFFFILLSPTPLDFPVTYLSSFYTDLGLSEQTQLKQRWQDEFPGVMWIDVQALIDQVRTFMHQASMAVSLLTSFTLVASLLVILAATKASQDARLRQWLVLRTLGASQYQIRLIGLGEYLLLGMITGIFATSLASITSLLMSVYWLKIPATFDPLLWLVGLLVSSSSLLMMAWLTQSSYLRMHPRQLAQAIED